MSAKSFFGGLLQGLVGGFAQGKLEQEERKYQERLTNRKNILAYFQNLMNRPDLTPEARSWAMKGLQAISSGNITEAKKLMEAIGLLGQGPQPIKTIGAGVATISPINKEGKIDPDKMTAAGLVPGAENLPTPRGGMPSYEAPTLDTIIPYSQDGVFVDPRFQAEEDQERALRFQEGIQNLAAQKALAIESMKGQYDLLQEEIKQLGEGKERQRKIDAVKADPNLSEKEKAAMIRAIETGLPLDKQTQWEESRAMYLKAYREKHKIPADQPLTGEQEMEAESDWRKATSQYGFPIYPVFESGNIVWKPRPEAIGGNVPRTIYDLTGIPRLGGEVGLSTEPPPQLQGTAWEQISGLNTALDLFDQVMPQLTAKATFGPVAGRITLAEIRKLGGLGASNADVDLATQLYNLTTSQAFANGGKQLTTAELKRFEDMIPQLSDTLDQALIKARNAYSLLNTSLKNKVKTLPPRIREQISPELRGRQAEKPTNDPLGIR